jgi:hypothetical protein
MCQFAYELKFKPIQFPGYKRKALNLEEELPIVAINRGVGARI